MKKHVDGDKAVHRAFDEISAIANGVRTALAASDWDELAALIRANKYQPVLPLAPGLP